MCCKILLTCGNVYVTISVKINKVVDKLPCKETFSVLCHKDRKYIYKKIVYVEHRSANVISSRAISIKNLTNESMKI